MRKIILILMLFMICGSVYSQFTVKSRIGNTVITDSLGYTKFNKSIDVKDSLIAHNGIYMQYGKLYMDTTHAISMYVSGGYFNIESLKPTLNRTVSGIITTTSGDLKFYSGYKSYSSIFKIYGYNNTTPNAWVFIDSNGIDLQQANMHFMVNGTPITGSGSSSNLFGYFNKDTSFTSNQHLKVKDMTIYSTGSDSVQFAVKTGGNLLITPTGTRVTAGTSDGNGSKEIYAGEYYRGTTLLTTYFNTAGTFTNIPYLASRNTFTRAQVTDTILAKNIKSRGGIVLQDTSGNNKITLYDGINVAQGITLNSGGYSHAVLNMDGSDGSWNFGDGATGDPRIMGFANDPTKVSYTFVGEQTLGMSRTGTHELSLISQGSSRLKVSNTITSTIPFIITGTTSYLLLSGLTDAEMNILTGVAGMLIWNTDQTRLYYYNGTVWNPL